MRAKGMSIEEIADITGLSDFEITAFGDEVKKTLALERVVVAATAIAAGGFTATCVRVGGFAAVRLFATRFRCSGFRLFGVLFAFLGGYLHKAELLLVVQARRLLGLRA